MFKKKKESKVERINFVDSKQYVELNVSGDIKRQIDMIGLSREDLAVLHSIQHHVQTHISEVVDAFYEPIIQEPTLINIIKSNSSIERLKKTLTIHISEMMDGKINDQFIEKRNRIAYVHVKIGLPTKWYIASFQQMQMSILQILQTYYKDSEDFMKIVMAVTKILNLEQQLVLEAYEQEIEKEREEAAQLKEKVVHKIKDASSNLASISEESDASIEEMTNRMIQVSQLSQKGTKTIEIVSNLSSEGSQKMISQKEHMGKILADLKEMLSEIHLLQQISNQINEIVTIVQTIAEQTNLLSLNASIEAARAGEHGKGFAIVAEEVRKLSDETKNSVSNVSQLIEGTKDQVDKISTYIESVEKLAENGMTSTNEANEVFEGIVQSILHSKQQSEKVEIEMNEISGVIKEISAAVSQLAVSADDLSHLTNEI
jgi:heam-based aerotactic trancducer